MASSPSRSSSRSMKATDAKATDANSLFPLFSFPSFLFSLFPLFFSDEWSIARQWVTDSY
eukprot:3467615-Prymnesium_polylepis.1